jgi:hypothetical protein
MGDDGGRLGPRVAHVNRAVATGELVGALAAAHAPRVVEARAVVLTRRVGAAVGELTRGPEVALLTTARAEALKVETRAAVLTRAVRAAVVVLGGRRSCGGRVSGEGRKGAIVAREAALAYTVALAVDVHVHAEAAVGARVQRAA